MSKELTYKDIVKLKKQIDNNKTSERVIYITYEQACRIENECFALEKALDESCKILSWDCPCGQDLIDDLDCENRCQPDIDYAECWKKYFLREGVN
jgi:hypothetical protein